MRYSSIVVGLLFTTLAGSVRADVFTNTWVATSGGTWTDAANWSDPDHLGQTDDTAAVFDLSALPSGETVLLPYVDGGVRAHGLVLGAADGADDDTWLFEQVGSYPQDKHPAFRFSAPAGAELPAVHVWKGVARFRVQLNGSAFLKTGAGCARFSYWASGTAHIRALEGTVETAGLEALKDVVVNLYGPDAAFSVYGNELTIFHLEDLDSTTGAAAPFDLGGREASFTQNGKGRTHYYDTLAGAGAISAGGSQRFSVARTQTGFTGAFRLRTGDIGFSSPAPGLFAYYAFGDAEAPGAAQVGPGLVPSGSPRVVEDADRGPVLSLDGSSHLASADAAHLPDGFPKGNSDYTVACWLKIAPDCPPQATLFYFGKWNTDGTCNLLRLHTENGVKGVMYTNFGNNRTVCKPETAVLYDGNWHHLAVTHGGGQSRLHVDGAMVDAYNASADVQDGEFWIGYGKNNNHFKGCLDDFVVCAGAVPDMNAFIVAGLSPAGPTAANTVEAYQAGVLHLGTDAEVATLSGPGALAKVRLAGDLSVAGTGAAREATEFRSAVVGSGALVKKGADYALTLSGPNDYDGATRVEQGVLAIRGIAPVGKLLGRWTFEDASNPGADASGNGFVLDGTGVTVVEDPARGKVASFANGAKLVSSAYPADFPSGSANYSLALWIKGDPSGDPSAGIAAWGQLGVDHKCALWRLDAGSGWMMTNWNENHYGNGQSFCDGVWHHVVWTADTFVNRVYVDGALVHNWERSKPRSVVLDGTTFNLGFNPATQVAFTGCLDDVRVYSFALSEAQARAVYSGAPATSNAQTLEFLPEPLYQWDFEDADAPGANTGSAADGSLSVFGAARCAAVEGRPGKVLDLTGETKSYLQAEAFPAHAPSGNADWTATFWMRPSSAISANDTALYWGDPEKHFVLVGYYSGMGSFRCTLKAGMDCWAPGYDIRNGGAEAKWHHVAAVKAGDRVRLYLDGFLVKEISCGTVDVGTSFFWIGRKQSSETDWFRGHLDDVRIYGTALTDKQILQSIRAEQFADGRGVLPATTDLSVAAGAVCTLEGVDQRVATVAGEGVIDVGPGATLRVGKSSTFDGRLDLASPDSLQLDADVVLKAKEATVAGAKFAGSRVCGAGMLVVGPPSTLILIR